MNKSPCGSRDGGDKGVIFFIFNSKIVLVFTLHKGIRLEHMDRYFNLLLIFL